jgi:hypothetical protein
MIVVRDGATLPFLSDPNTTFADTVRLIDRR